MHFQPLWTELLVFSVCWHVKHLLKLFWMSCQNYLKASVCVVWGVTCVLFSGLWRYTLSITCPLIWGMRSLTLVSMSLSTRYPRCTSMIICWGHRRPLPSSLFSLDRQLSSVFSSRPSSSQVMRCWEGMRRAKSLCCACALGHAGLPPLWSEIQTLCSAFPSTPSSALMQIIL